VDVVIVGRGGGAREDLWAFNDENVARALADCAVPTISAVGHEVDVTLCDLVADLRAATPSAAAEAAVPVLAETRREAAALALALRELIERRLDADRAHLAREARAVHVAAARLVERRRARLELLAGRLHALSPLATLSRGYAVARLLDGRALTSAADFAPGLDFELLLRDGRVRATARESDPTPPSGR
jgi:exodeoxyribonuclease VII large subunit